MNSGKNDSDVTVGSVHKAFQLVETLRALDGANMRELIDELGWAKSTVYSYLRSLEEREYIVYEDGEYVLGFQFLELGEYVKERKEIYSLIEPKVDALAEDTGERVQFVTSEHGKAVYVRIAKGEHAVSTGGRLGRRRNMLHATAAGKAILAHLPDEDVRGILDRTGLPELTPNTITDEAELFDALQRVDERGYAVNNEEHITGLRAVAVPIEHPEEGVIGALSVAGPAHRIGGEKLDEQLPNQLLGVKSEIELDIQYG